MFKTQKSIKQIYSDALYWATSNKSKTTDYHLTRTKEAILRKLIHYSTRNEKITYSNKLIAQHTFIDETQVEKAIPRLTKIGYLKTICFTISEGGKVVKRRTININWEFLEKISKEIPQSELSDTENEFEAIINKSQIESTPSHRYFDSEQLEAFDNFNPPEDEYLHEDLQLQFAKDYVIANAEKLYNECSKKYEFEYMVNYLIKYDLPWFERDLKSINQKDFKEYLENKTNYVNEKVNQIKSN